MISIIGGVKFGIEKENLRIDKKGNISTKENPRNLGNLEKHPYFTNDFSQAHLEMVTPPCDSIDEAYNFLFNLHKIAIESVQSEGEILWNQSMPPDITEQKKIVIAKFESKEKEQYRQYLLEKYGLSKQMMCGIHFNISFTDSLLSQISRFLNISQDQVYLKAIQNLNQYRWLITYLYGASPSHHHSFQLNYTKIYCKNKNDKNEIIHSLRTGCDGYKNIENFNIDYSCIEKYNKSVEKLIQEKKIISYSELYEPIKLKFNEDKSISHIEVRCIDLNPLNPIGLDKQTLDFTFIMMLFSLFKNRDCLDRQKSLINQESIACISGVKKIFLDDELLSVEAASRKVLSQIQDLIIDNKNLKIGNDLKLSFEAAKKMLSTPQSLLAHKIKAGVDELGFVEFHLNLLKKQNDELIKDIYTFYGYESLELSTQLILKEAMLQGIEYKVIDTHDNFISLTQNNKNGSKTHLIKQATKTALDSYDSIMAMENKKVTKYILEKNNINTPDSKYFENINDALQNYDLFPHKKIVIKPKSTNFGLGVTILNSGFAYGEYEIACKFAFSYDQTIIIEEFIYGQEYRFFVLNDKVEAVLYRVPANITGDGHNSIKKLIEIKNSNPLRGSGYKTPLEKIQITKIELDFLKNQGLSIDSILENNRQVFLRENSNISTGGDSIDVTDDIHLSYKEIAISSAKALNAKITGLDMIVLDTAQEANKSNHSVIELNFNPAIHIHCYPLVGKNRKLNNKIVNLLFNK